jgi:hypothetical protein
MRFSFLKWGFNCRVSLKRPLRSLFASDVTSFYDNHAVRGGTTNSIQRWLLIAEITYIDEMDRNMISECGYAGIWKDAVAT